MNAKAFNSFSEKIYYCVEVTIFIIIKIILWELLELLKGGSPGDEYGNTS